MGLQKDNCRGGFMKAFGILFLSVFLSVFSCTPIDLDSKKGRSDRGVEERDFNIPGLKDISLDELREKTLTRENCFNYQPCPGVSLFGEHSPSRPFRNCACKGIDEGLKPICEEEKKAKELLKHYQNKRDRKGAEDVEEYLRELDSVKYEFADSIYEMADEVDEMEEIALDTIDEKEKVVRQRYKVLAILGRIFVKNEVGSFTSTLDFKARAACRSLDLSKIKTRGRR